MSATLDAALQRIVDSLIAGYDSTDPKGWRPCWRAASTLPMNAVTGVAYQGANVLLLWGTQLDREYPSNVWATYKQWASLGAQVRKGEHGAHCVKWLVPRAKDDPSGSDEPQRGRRLVPSAFVVFNAAQVDGALAEDERPELPPIPRFEAWLDAIDHRLVHGQPCYMPVNDIVSMPHRHEFTDDDRWASTYAHELAHWSGHSSRLARDLSGRFGSASYAMEELVAEISAAFTCAMLDISDIEDRPDHHQYIRHWLDVLKEQPRALLTVAQAAQRASTYLASFSKESTDGATADEADPYPAAG